LTAEQIEDLKNLVQSYKSKFIKKNDILLPIFHWCLKQKGFNINSNDTVEIIPNENRPAEWQMIYKKAELEIQCKFFDLVEELAVEVTSKQPIQILYIPLNYNKYVLTNGDLNNKKIKQGLYDKLEEVSNWLNELHTYELFAIAGNYQVNRAPSSS